MVLGVRVGERADLCPPLKGDWYQCAGEHATVPLQLSLDAQGKGTHSPHCELEAPWACVCEEQLSPRSRTRRGTVFNEGGPVTTCVPWLRWMKRCRAGGSDQLAAGLKRWAFPREKRCWAQMCVVFLTEDLLPGFLLLLLLLFCEMSHFIIFKLRRFLPKENSDETLRLLLTLLWVPVPWVWASSGEEGKLLSIKCCLENSPRVRASCWRTPSPNMS